MCNCVVQRTEDGNALKDAPFRRSVLLLAFDKQTKADRLNRLIPFGAIHFPPFSSWVENYRTAKWCLSTTAHSTN